MKGVIKSINFAVLKESMVLMALRIPELSKVLRACINQLTTVGVLTARGALQALRARLPRGLINYMPQGSRVKGRKGPERVNSGP